MVWFHGGGFVSGAGSFYGPEYLLDEDIVLVTVNYRLGPIGKATAYCGFTPGGQSYWNVKLNLYQNLMLRLEFMVLYIHSPYTSYDDDLFPLFNTSDVHA